MSSLLSQLRHLERGTKRWSRAALLAHFPILAACGICARHNTDSLLVDFNLSPARYSPKSTAKMGRVRTKTVKKSAKVVIERYYPKLTLDFETNKRICDEIAIIASKRLRNKVGKALVLATCIATLL